MLRSSLPVSHKLREIFASSWSQHSGLMKVSGTSWAEVAILLSCLPLCVRSPQVLPLMKIDLLLLVTWPHPHSDLKPPQGCPWRKVPPATYVCGHMARRQWVKPEGGIFWQLHVISFGTWGITQPQRWVIIVLNPSGVNLRPTLFICKMRMSVPSTSRLDSTRMTEKTN